MVPRTSWPKCWTTAAKETRRDACGPPCCRWPRATAIRPRRQPRGHGSKGTLELRQVTKSLSEGSPGVRQVRRLPEWIGRLTHRHAITIVLAAAIAIHILALASLPLIVTPDGQQYLGQAAVYL